MANSLIDPVLTVDHIAKRYGSGEKSVDAIGDISFQVASGEFLSIVGPSGCGKTTLLRCLSGLMSPTTGEVRMRGALISGTPENMAVVFQDYSRSLFPWMSVSHNVAFPLRRKKLGRVRERNLVQTSLEAVGLSDAGHLHPWQLSGGMQQRVAIARALAYEPQILLMDEPFASLDAQTRADLEDLTLRLRHEFGVTVVFVTHDIDESVYMSDRVVALTARPSRVLETVNIDLPRPRDQLATKELPEFTRYRNEVYRLVRQTESKADRDETETST